jgi:hypothetical protein
MGLLNIFRAKESHTHFERDDEGNVISVEHSGDEPKRGLFRSRTPVSDKFEKEYYEKHPEKRLGNRLRSAGKSFDKHVVSKLQPVNMGRVSRPPRRSSYRVHENYNPVGSMFDKGISFDSSSIMFSGPGVRKKHKSGGHKGGGGKRFAVVGGKAYPIVGSGKKKKGKKSRVSKYGFGGFDMMDNWGFMKK